MIREREPDREVVEEAVRAEEAISRQREATAAHTDRFWGVPVLEVR